MDVLERADIEELLATLSPPCVSIYLPTGPVVSGPDQAPIRLRGHLAEARRDLEEIGLRRAERDELLAPLTVLLDDTRFWQYQADGLAAFATAGWSRHLRVPIPLPDLVVVGERFHLHPLAELMTADEPFLLLSCSQQRTRLFRGNRWSLEEVPVPAIPQGVDDVAPEHAQQPALQLRRSAAGSSNAAFFHGHGGLKDAAPAQRERYLHAVERSLRPVLAGHQEPLVLAGPQPLIAEFRGLLRYPYVDVVVDHHTDHLPLEELHDVAWNALEPQRARDRQLVMDRFGGEAGTGRTVAGADPVAAAAAEGRVEVLLVPPAVELADREQAMLALIDDALVHTLRHGGEIVVLPGDAAARVPLPAALLRY